MPPSVETETYGKNITTISVMTRQRIVPILVSFDNNLGAFYKSLLHVLRTSGSVLYPTLVTYLSAPALILHFILFLPPQHKTLDLYFLFAVNNTRVSQH